MGLVGWLKRVLVGKEIHKFNIGGKEVVLYKTLFAHKTTVNGRTAHKFLMNIEKDGTMNIDVRNMKEEHIELLPDIVDVLARHYKAKKVNVDIWVNEDRLRMAFSKKGFGHREVRLPEEPVEQPVRFMPSVIHRYTKEYNWRRRKK